MTQVMILTFGQSQIFLKMGKKNLRTCHILDAILPTDFILGTKVQPNKEHSMTQVQMVKVTGQGQISLNMVKI